MKNKVYTQTGRDHAITCFEGEGIALQLLVAESFGGRDALLQRRDKSKYAIDQKKISKHENVTQQSMVVKYCIGAAQRHIQWIRDERYS